MRQQDHAQWASLFRAYREFYRLAPDPEVVDRVWGWITEAGHEVTGLVAEADGVLLGFAHYRTFSRPSTGTVGLYLDDLYTAETARGQGAGRALIDAITAEAARDGRSVVRWITAKDNTPARRLYDSLARSTEWVTYDRTPAPPAGEGR